MIRKSTLLPLALALPVLGLAGSWALSHRQAQQGTDWEVPVAGYDPRDLLRGHYIRFRYEWPGADNNYTDALCLKGKAPTIADAHWLAGAHDSPACAEIVRRNVWADWQNDGIQSGQLYVAQTKARDLEKKLADPKLKAIVTVRIRKDGKVTPLSMRFRPRTNAEIAKDREEREAANAPPPAFIISR
ncbi:MAG: GDYXXLXY domain-containing protein [Sphingomonadales bacterium]|nr:GDYXXLXY domain-containing protein [Sphingomonadales bacterium]